MRAACSFFEHKLSLLSSELDSKAVLDLGYELHKFPLASEEMLATVTRVLLEKALRDVPAQVLCAVLLEHLVQVRELSETSEPEAPAGPGWYFSTARGAIAGPFSSRSAAFDEGPVLCPLRSSLIAAVHNEFQAVTEPVSEQERLGVRQRRLATIAFMSHLYVSKDMVSCQLISSCCDTLLAGGDLSSAHFDLEGICALLSICGELLELEGEHGAPFSMDRCISLIREAESSRLQAWRVSLIAQELLVLHSRSWRRVPLANGPDAASQGLLDPASRMNHCILCLMFGEWA